MNKTIELNEEIDGVVWQARISKDSGDDWIEFQELNSVMYFSYNKAEAKTLVKFINAAIRELNE